MNKDCDKCNELEAECYECVKLSRDRLLEVLHVLNKAIIDEGPKPSMHRRIMTSHRHEWPSLWKAIDRAVKEYRGQNASNRM